MAIGNCAGGFCSAWVSDWEGEGVARISERASAIANLTLYTAEEMQVTEVLLHRVSKNCANLFLSELCQISTDRENFWHKDSKENKLF